MARKKATAKPKAAEKAAKVPESQPEVDENLEDEIEDVETESEDGEADDSETEDAEDEESPPDSEDPIDAADRAEDAARPPTTEDVDRLYQEAAELKIRGRAQMSVEELQAAVQGARAAGVMQEPQSDLGDEDSPPTQPGTEPRMVTAEEVQSVRAATDELLERFLAGPGAVEAPHLAAYVRGELEARRLEREQQAAKIERTSEMERYRVTKGGRYVSKDGQISELPVDSMLTPHTHDLRHVQSQGIEFERCRAPRVVHDELGRQHTEWR